MADEEGEEEEDEMEMTGEEASAAMVAAATERNCASVADMAKGPERRDLSSHMDIGHILN